MSKHHFFTLLSGSLSLFLLAPGCTDDPGNSQGQDGSVSSDSGSNQDGSVTRDSSVGPDGGTPLSSFSFLVYGDSRADGSDCEGNRVHIGLVAQMLAEPDISFVAHMGDMVTGYADSTCFAANGSCTGADDFGSLADIISPFLSKTPAPGVPAFFIPVIGNHEEGSDWYPDPCGTEVCDVFDLAALVNHPTPNNDPCGADYPSQAYYSFQLGSVAFFVLHANYDYFDFFECNYPPDGWDTCDDYCRNGPRDAQLYETCWNVHQYDWLSDGLTAADQDPNITNKVIFLHAPIYTSFDDHTPFTSAPDIADLADQHNVSLVMNGHNHCYERTHAVRADAVDPSGTVYVTTSGGGVGTYDAAGDWFTAAHSAAHHYVRVDVDTTGFSVSAIDTEGNTFDTFHLP